MPFLLSSHKMACVYQAGPLASSYATLHYKRFDETGIEKTIVFSRRLLHQGSDNDFIICWRLCQIMDIKQNQAIDGFS